MVETESGQAFGIAVCQHFRLDAEKVQDDMRINSARDEVFSVTLTIALTADDLAAIAKNMGATLWPLVE